MGDELRLHVVYAVLSAISAVISHNVSFLYFFNIEIADTCPILHASWPHLSTVSRCLLWYTLVLVAVCDWQMTQDYPIQDHERFNRFLSEVFPGQPKKVCFGSVLVCFLAEHCNFIAISGYSHYVVCRLS